MNFNKNVKLVIIATLAIILIFTLTACGGGKSEKIVVGGKDYTEQDILTHLVSEVIEAKTDYEVDRKPYLGGSGVVTASIMSGDVDVMVDYTGTGLMSVLKKEATTDPQEAYEIVVEGYEKEYDLMWLEPLGFNNTYALTMRREMAEDMGIKTISDLKDYDQDFRFASVQEFLERSDGYDELKPFYGLEFGEVLAMDPGLGYTALKDGQVEVSVSFSTDGRIPAFDLVILEDDKNFFPPYDASIIVRKDSLEKYSGLSEALDSLTGKISIEDMASMNAKVDLDKETPREVAKDWLIENNIIEE